MDRFSYQKTNIEGVYIITPKKIVDNRGFYERFFCAKDFEEIGFNTNIKQINHSKTNEKGVIRGFHYQTPPHTEIKVVRCLKGAIFDVALDVRRNSKTFLQHVSVDLNEENDQYLILPEGIAHAFQTLTNNSEIIYMVSKFYAPNSDIAINPLDPKLNVNWPIEINKALSKELNAKFLNESFQGI